MASRLKSVHELLKVSGKDIQNIFRAYPSVMVFFLENEQISIKDFILLKTKYMKTLSKLSNNTTP